MLEYPGMRRELQHYLAEIVGIQNSLSVTGAVVANYKDAWFKQAFAADFVLDDMNIMSDSSGWIGVVFYDIQENASVLQVGKMLHDFHEVGASGAYEKAFRSEAWRGAYQAANAALALLLSNDKAATN